LHYLLIKKKDSIIIDDNQSRRDFIKRLAALIAAGVVSPSLFFGVKEGFEANASPTGNGACSSSLLAVPHSLG